MIKFLTVILAVVAVQSQRPPYAGSANRIPQVLPQYTQSSVDLQGSTVRPDVLGNRINSDDEVPAGFSATANLPMEANGDINVIRRIESWPRERQPYWYLNWKKLEEHRGITPSTSINWAVNARPLTTRWRN